MKITTRQTRAFVMDEGDLKEAFADYLFKWAEETIAPGATVDISVDDNRGRKLSFTVIVTTDVESREVGWPDPAASARGAGL